MSPSRNSQGGPLGPGTSPSAGTISGLIDSEHQILTPAMTTLALSDIPTAPTNVCYRG
jgi:hypothetical protein